MPVKLRGKPNGHIFFWRCPTLTHPIDALPSEPVAFHFRVRNGKTGGATTRNHQMARNITI